MNSCRLSVYLLPHPTLLYKANSFDDKFRLDLEPGTNLEFNKLVLLCK